MSKNIKTNFYFLILYIIVISAISGFYIAISNENSKNVSLITKELHGVEYLKNIQNFTLSTYFQGDIIEHYDLKVKESVKKTMNRTINNIKELQKIYPEFKNDEFKKQLEKIVNNKMSYSDYQKFYDNINTENYRIGDVAEIHLTNNREVYLLGTLLTHYLPELSISIILSHNILEEYLVNGSISDEKQTEYIEENRLIFLSSEEVSHIIELLDVYPHIKKLSETMEEMKKDIESLRLDKTKFISSTLTAVEIEKYLDSIHKILTLSLKLNEENVYLIKNKLIEDKESLDEKNYLYRLLLAFILIVVSMLFIYLYFIYNSNLKKDIEIAKRQEELENWNTLLEKRVEAEVDRNRRNEQHLIQQSRMAQMGEMISMIAHQWRQPLGAISSTTMSMNMELELDVHNMDTKDGQKKLKEYFRYQLSIIEEFVNNLSSTIDDFRNFYKPNKKAIKSTLEEVCNKALKIITASLKADNVTLTIECESADTIEIYNNEMLQVILNILKNAQDNFKEKHIKKRHITITISGRDISICDNGGGIPDDIIDNIFDPYFSTKIEKNGTGLGLYMSKTIVEDHHHGVLDVYNRDDGVCFNIRLHEKIPMN